MFATAEAARAIEALYATGHWLHACGRAEDAMQVFRAMLLTAPSDERGWLGLAASHEAIGQSAVAIELYRAALAATSGSARLALALGRALRSTGEVDDARESFRAALEMASDAGETGLASLAESEVRS